MRVVVTVVPEMRILARRKGVVEESMKPVGKQAGRHQGILWRAEGVSDIGEKMYLEYRACLLGGVLALPWAAK